MLLVKNQEKKNTFVLFWSKGQVEEENFWVFWSKGQEEEEDFCQLPNRCDLWDLTRLGASKRRRHLFSFGVRG